MYRLTLVIGLDANNPYFEINGLEEAMEELKFLLEQGYTVEVTEIIEGIE